MKVAHTKKIAREIFGEFSQNVAILAQDVAPTFGFEFDQLWHVQAQRQS